MVTTAEQVARAVLLNYPLVRCFACLALQVGMLEKDAREAGQLIVARDEFLIDRRVCSICGRIEDVLASGKVP